MNNRLINGLVIASLLVGQSFGLTSCTDYDDDIKNLQTQIDGINVSLGELQQLIKSGSVITDVTSTADGINITLSDGKPTLSPMVRTVLTARTVLPAHPGPSDPTATGMRMERKPTIAPSVSTARTASRARKVTKAIRATRATKAIKATRATRAIKATRVIRANKVLPVPPVLRVPRANRVLPVPLVLRVPRESREFKVPRANRANPVYTMFPKRMASSGSTRMARKWRSPLSVGNPKLKRA